MAVYRICDKWDVVLGSRNEDVEKHDDGYSESTSMLNFLDKYPKQVARNQWCFHYLVNQLEGKPDRIVHYCAGAGFNATICKHVLKPKQQVLMDIDPDCVRLLKMLFPSDVVSNTSFYESAGKYPTDIAVLDVNDCTAVKLTRNAQFLDVLSKVVHTSYVTMIADIAITHLPVNRKVYSKSLGCDIVTIQDYVNGLSAWLYNAVGAFIAVAAGHHGTTWLMLEGTTMPLFPEATYVKAPPEADRYFYKVNPC